MAGFQMKFNYISLNIVYTVILIKKHVTEILSFNLFPKPLAPLNI